MARRRKKKHRKVKKVSSMKNDHVVHVRVDSPESLRKVILRTAIDSAKLIQDYVELKAIREEKKRLVGQLYDVLRMIRKIESELKSRHLPKVKEEKPVKVAPMVREAPKAEKPVEEFKEERPVYGKSDIEKLQDELKGVEKRLSKL